ncbi:hypothetical protein HHL19_18690 [Streptomyces sp. R302]|uniref:hypothetical protein n=1 Tax=unclassified Streptomyces TaxID=2593676 RepID=UPI00145E5A1F|nr:MULTISPECIES: hypothetical protein [unclassified Streptomyces]NML54791.1 hypothetical protein [Streptomyces sp. R301]NML80640.1 hypothetical protein [Streptomyces sp. R302]
MDIRVFRGLNAEWALVCAEPSAGARVRGWLEEAGVLTPGEGPSELEELLGWLGVRDRQVGREHSDRWMGALLAVAAGEGAGARLAARVVVQAMVDGAVRTTLSLLRPGRDFDEVGQVVVAALYGVVRAYPLHRTRKVAANLRMETLHRASRELRADDPQALGWDAELAGLASGEDIEEAACRAGVVEQAVAGGLMEGAREWEPARAELAELLLWGVQTGLLSAARARQIADEVRAESREQAGVSAAARRKRRSRTVARLRPVARQWVRAA